jgi:pilus assembly protein Flp/PilA
MRRRAEARSPGLEKSGRAIFFGESAMKAFIARLMADQSGGEMLEYALVAGLIVVSAIAVTQSVGCKLLARWTSISNSGL